MATPLTIAPARSQDWPEALDLLFQYLPPEARRLRCTATQNLLENGELLPAGLLLARQNVRLAAVLVCLPLQGASALFWPPQVVPGLDPIAVADPLDSPCPDLATIAQHQARPGFRRRR